MHQSIQTVALCGGAGSFLIQDAIAVGAQVFISADIKYHEFFEANNQITVIDIGHFESEQHTIKLLEAYLKQKFSNFAVLCTKVVTNPIKYYVLVMAEKTVVERLTDLYRLQSINSELDQISVLQGELPMEVADLEDEIQGLDKRIGRLEDSVKEYEDKIAGFRNKIKESETLITRYNQQFDEVKNNREYEALSKEIELQNLDIQLAEKRIRENSANIEGKKETLAAATERKDVKLKDLELKKVELEKS